MAKAFCKYLEHNISSIYFSYNLQYSDCANPVGIIAETVNKHLCKNYIRNSDTNIKKHLYITEIKKKIKNQKENPNRV